MFGKEIEKTFGDYLDAAGTMISGVGGQIIGNTFGFGKGCWRPLGTARITHRGWLQTSATLWMMWLVD